MYTENGTEHNSHSFMSQDRFDTIVKNINGDYDPVLNSLKEKGYILVSSLRKVILIKDRVHCATIAAEPFNIIKKFPIWYTKSEEVYNDIIESISDQYGVFDMRTDKVIN